MENVGSIPIRDCMLEKRDRREYSKIRYLKNKEKLLKDMKIYYNNNKKYFMKRNKKLYEDGKKIMCNLKLNGCSICGYKKNIHILEFHHVEPKLKKFNIDTKSSSYCKIETITNELNKCILLCPNCHGEITNE